MIINAILDTKNSQFGLCRILKRGGRDIESIRKLQQPKKRKLENENYETRQEQTEMREGTGQEKRKADKNVENEAQPYKKRKKTSDIRTLLQAQADKNITSCNETRQ